MPDSKRSRMNQEMLERARKLRDEASEMEVASKALEQIASAVKLPESTSTSSSSKSTKSTGEEFISRFPVERLTANTSIFTLGAFQTNATVEDISNGTYRSVLVDREKYTSKQKSQLDKLSGEAVRSKVIKDSNTASKAFMNEAKGLVPIEEATVESESEVKVDRGRIPSAYEVALSDMTEQSMMKALNKIIDSDGTERFELKTKEQYCSDLNMPWFRKQALSSAAAVFAMNEKSLNEQYSIALFEFATFTVLEDSAEDKPESFPVVGKIFDNSVYRRADLINARVSGKTPSLPDLKLLLEQAESESAENDPFLEPTCVTWLRSTIERLEEKSVFAIKERELIWGIKPTEEEIIYLSKVEAIPITSSDKPEDTLTSLLNGENKDLEGVMKAAIIGLVKNTKEGRDALANVKNINGTSAITADSLTDMTLTEVLTTFDVADVESMNELANKYFPGIADDNFNTAAERFLSEYFDRSSRFSSQIISREGAGRCQVEMLKDIFTVSNVKMSNGAVIFDGKYKGKSSSQFATQLSERFEACSMKDEIGYTIIMNEPYPDMEGGMQQAALDMMLGRSPCVIVYPKNWNSSATTNLADSGRKVIRSALSTLATVSSAVFAAGCLDMFNPTSTYMITGVIPDDFLPLAFLPLTIQYTSTLVEAVVGRLKGFNVTSLVVPSFSLFTFGSRSAYTSMPKNRNDIFDTAAIGVSTALIYSLATFYVGLQITAGASSEVVAAYPSVSLALLNTNAVVTQLLNYELPQLSQIAIATATATNIAASTAVQAVAIGTDISTTSAIAVDATIHLHWLAIGGAISFIANTLQLFPLDNSAGSKLGMAVLGNEQFTIVRVIGGTIKVLVVLPALFAINSALAVVPAPKLLFDYFVTSQLAGDNEVQLQCHSESVSIKIT